MLHPIKPNPESQKEELAVWKVLSILFNAGLLDHNEYLRARRAVEHCYDLIYYHNDMVYRAEHNIR